MTPRQWINRQLAQPIQITHNKEPLEVVVSDLSHASGIHFVPEPGLYQSVPVVSLSSDNATVLRTLETLAGFTRIAFEVRDDSIYLRLTPGAGQSTPDSIIGRISIPAGDGTFMDVYIRESDLSGEQNELRKKKIEEAIKNMQKTLTAPPTPPTPATAPAPVPTTAPATKE